MRRVFLCLLTVLLLARGWVADAMALERAARPAPVVASQMADTGWHHAAAHAHCDDMAAQPAGAEHTPAADGAPASHAGCSTCDLCHSAVVDTATLWLPAARPAARLPGHTPVRYASAPPARLHKPPIG